MAKSKHPSNPWQNNYIVFGVETIELAQETLPISYSHMTVEANEIAGTAFQQIAWGRHFAGSSVARGELRQALPAANTLRQLTLQDLDAGSLPLEALTNCEKVLRLAAKNKTLIVTHDQSGLSALLNAIESWLDRDLPPLTVVSTGVLERARLAKLVLKPTESPRDFYRRVANFPGDEPHLLGSFTASGLNDGIMEPSHRMFPAFATHRLYQYHFGNRLLGGVGEGYSSAS